MKLSHFRRSIKIRDNVDEHRQATWLELFLDLGYVVAVSSLSHIFKEGFSGQTIVEYSVFFFLIFWIWNRFTWYASFYDNDDVAYRFSYLISLFPVLGLINSFDAVLKGDFFYATIYYILCNCILIYLWSRVLRRANEYRKNARTFLTGYSISTLVLIASLFLNPGIKPYFFILAVCIEIISPILGWSVTKGRIPVHTGHIVERHGLFNIILLGEGILSIFKNYEMLYTNHWYVLVLSFIVVISLWWIYFDCGFGFRTNLSKNIRRVFTFGYGQFFIYLSLLFVFMALEFGLHQFHYNLKSEINPIMLAGIATGVFILALTGIQLSISTYNPKRVYIPRTIFGILLILLSLLMEEKVVLLISIASVLVIILINEIKSWTYYKVHIIEKQD